MDEAVVTVICPHCGANIDGPPKTLALCGSCLECVAMVGPLFAEMVSVLEMPADVYHQVRAEQMRRRAELGRLS